MNWKVIFAVAALSCSLAEASVTRKVFEYELGNQITRSSVLVLSSGLVVQTRSHIGKAEYLDDVQLDQKTIQSLVDDVDAAAKVSSVQNDHIPAAKGGPYGQLIGFTSDGRQSLIYGLFPGNGNEKILVCQPGQAGDLVREFIQTLVRDRMPLDTVPCR